MEKKQDIINNLKNKIIELENKLDNFRKKEAQLHKEWENIFNAVMNPIFLLDAEQTIISVNKATCDITGISQEGLIGKKCYEIMHGNEFPPEECPVRKLKETKTLEISEMEIEMFGRIFLVSCTPVLNKDVGIEKIIHISTDITEKKKIEAEKAEIEKNLIQAQKMDAIGQLAAGVAHDFNNILTAIIAYSHFLKLKMKNNVNLISYVDNILNSSEKAANIIRNLLTLGKKQALSLRVVSINGLLQNIESILRKILGENIELKIKKGKKEEIFVQADYALLEQALLNLVINARDAMPDGGTLTISSDIAKPHKDLLKKYGEYKDQYMGVISVTDTGVGIEKEYQDRIFEPFFTTKETGKSSGLGLAMVYGIVKHHGGFIEVDSEKGKGTGIKIYLPLSDKKPERLKTEDYLSIKKGKETILLAEDDSDVRSSIGSILEEYGYKVIEAVDGEEMVKKFMDNKDNIHLLIIDLIMPKKSGKEAYDEILKIRQGIKAIFISGYKPEIIMKKSISDENLDFILKPVSPIILLKKIRQMLD
jgi:PAS domain S-box-containing protein